MVKSFWFFLLLVPFFSFSQFSFEHSIYFETDEFFIEKTEETRLYKFIESLSGEDVANHTMAPQPFALLS